MLLDKAGETPALLGIAGIESIGEPRASTLVEVTVSAPTNPPIQRQNITILKTQTTGHSDPPSAPHPLARGSVTISFSVDNTPSTQGRDHPSPPVQVLFKTH